MARVFTGILLCSLITGMAGCSRDTGDPPGQSTLHGNLQTVNNGLHRWCSGCHAPPSPSDHPPSEWPAVVLRMQNHRIIAGMDAIPKKDIDSLINYLQTGPH